MRETFKIVHDLAPMVRYEISWWAHSDLCPHTEVGRTESRPF